MEMIILSYRCWSIRKDV